MLFVKKKIYTSHNHNDIIKSLLYDFMHVHDHQNEVCDFHMLYMQWESVMLSFISFCIRFFVFIILLLQAFLPKWCVSSLSFIVSAKVPGSTPFLLASLALRSSRLALSLARGEPALASSATRIENMDEARPDP